MHPRTLLIGALLLLASALTVAQSPAPAGPAVLEIIIVETGTNVPAAVPKLVEMMKRANGIAQKMGSHGKARLWSMVWAGPNAGHFVIAVESPNLGVVATDGAKMQMSPEWQKMVADFSAAGFKVVSQSLAMEVPTS